VEVEPFGRVAKRELDAERFDLARFEGLELA
jgi:hypothetical protein